MRLRALALGLALLATPALTRGPPPGLAEVSNWRMIASAAEPAAMMFLDVASIRRTATSVDFRNLTIYRDVQRDVAGPSFDTVLDTLRVDCTTFRYNLLGEVSQLGRTMARPSLVLLGDPVESREGSMLRREFEAVCGNAPPGEPVASPIDFARDYFRAHPAAAPAQ